MWFRKYNCDDVLDISFVACTVLTCGSAVAMIDPDLYFGGLCIASASLTFLTSVLIYCVFDKL